MAVQFQNQHVTVFESALYRTTSTVVETPELILVADPGVLPEEINQIRKHVGQIRGERPVYLLFTHSDWDHIIGYGAFEGAKVIATRAFQENPFWERSVEDILNYDDEHYICRSYPIEYPEVDIPVLLDGQVKEVGDTRLVFYLAPGHTADGLFTLVEPYGIWLSGDYLSNIEFPFVYHSFQDYLQTLSKASQLLQNHSLRLLAPGHGDVATEREEMQMRIYESEQYLHKVIRQVQKQERFDEKELLKRYSFPMALSRFHRENVELAYKEFSALN